MERIEQRMTNIPSEKTAQRVSFLERLNLALIKRGNGMHMIMRSVATFRAKTRMRWLR